MQQIGYDACGRAVVYSDIGLALRPQGEFQCRTLRASVGTLGVVFAGVPVRSVRVGL